jgi:hypothetical protein
MVQGTKIIKEDLYRIVCPLHIQEPTYHVMTEFYSRSAIIIDVITYSSVKTITKS